MGTLTSFLAWWEPIFMFTVFNVIIVTGLYISALSGQLSLATAAIAGIGGYISGVLTVNFGVPFWPAVFAATAAGGLIGTFLAAITVRMSLFILKLTTLAFGEAVVVIVLNTDYMGGANSFTGMPLYTSVPVAVGAMLVAIFIAWRFDGSRLGLAARAVRDDPLAAASTGISILRIRIVTFALGAAIVGAGGAIQAHYVLIMNPQELGFFVSLNYIIFLLVGGLYSLSGAILGAVVMTALPELLRFAHEYRQILYGATIVAIIMLRPDGLITRRPTGVPSRLQWLLTYSGLAAVLRVRTGRIAEARQRRP